MADPAIRPVQFFRGWVRFLLTAVFPIAFMTTFPVQALLGRLEGWAAPASLGLAVASFAGASLFWRFGLRYYIGASS